MAALDPAFPSKRPRVEGPYVGPYAFSETDRDVFHGRDREAQRLLALTISERVVLFYAQSGAGKTSLVHARLVPELRDEGFHVFPPARVGLPLPPARVGLPLPRKKAPANIYAYSALEKLNPKRTLDETLDGFLRDHRARQTTGSVPRVLILDQFEEILNAHPECWEQRLVFFQQLRNALRDDPALSVVLVMREDRIAGLDRYAVNLPGGLRARFYMERLRVKEAITAIRKPAELAGRPFEPGVAEQLAQDLSQVRIAGQEKPIPGETVEPVQLQVVCLQLWKNLLRHRPGASITAQDLKDFGNVDEALEAFYTDAVAEAAKKSGVPPGRIRQWCGTALITPTRIRSQVARLTRTTGDLPNEAVDSLEEFHLLRRENARGGIWHELAHDRLIEPVLRSNQRWLGIEKEKSQLAEDAAAWQSYGKRDNSFLYRGKRLQEVLEAKEPKSELEQEFLAASKKREAFTSRLKNVLIVSLVLALIISLGFAYTAWRQWQSALKQQQLASSRELAFVAMNATASDPQLGLALALYAIDRAHTTQAEAALHYGLQLTTVHKVWSPLHTPVYVVSLSPDGKYLATSGRGGEIFVWDVQARWRIASRKLPSVSDVTALAFDPGGRRLAAGNEDGQVFLWSLDRGPLRQLSLQGGSINSIAFSPYGIQLAVAAENAPPLLWDLERDLRLPLKGGHLGSVVQVVFNRDGRFLATAGVDGQTILWNTSSGEQLRQFLETDPVTSVTFSPEGRLAYFTQRGGSIRDLTTGEEERISGLSNVVLSAIFSPDGRLLAGVDLNGLGSLWDARSGALLRSLPLSRVGTGSVSFSQDLRSLALAGERGYSESTPATLWRIESLSGQPLVADSIAGVAFRDDGMLLAAASQGEVILWGPASGLRRAERPCAMVATISASGGFVACPDTRGSVEVWNGGAIFSGRPGEVVQAFESFYSPGSHVFDLGADGKVLATASSVQVKLWDVASGRQTAGWETSQPISSLVLAPEGQRLATGSTDGSVQLWDLGENPPKPIAALSPHGSPVAAVTFSPRGERLAVLYFDGSVRLWEIAANKDLRLLLPVGITIRSLAFSPDGQRLATVSNENAVDLWDATGNELFRLRSFFQPIESIAFRRDGSYLAVASAGGSVWMEPLDLEELVRLARERSRELTEAEKRKYGLK